MSQTYEHSYETPQPVDRLSDDIHALLVVNPKSTNHGIACRQVEEMQSLKYADRHDVIETGPLPSDTREKILDKLRTNENTYNCMVVFAGDGTKNVCLTTIRNAPESATRSLPVVLGNGGGKGDGHHMTQGRNPNYLQSLAGQPVAEVFPGVMVISPQDRSPSQTVEAYFHAGIGISGKIAWEVNQQGHRSRIEAVRERIERHRSAHTDAAAAANLAQAQTFHQYLTASCAFVTRSFTFADKDESDHEVLEWLAVNGNIVGGMPIFPGNLAQKGFEVVQARNWPRGLYYLGQTALGRHGMFKHIDEANFFVAPRSDKQIVRLSYDGETLDINRPATEIGRKIGAYIHMKIAEQPAYVPAPALFPVC